MRESILYKSSSLIVYSSGRSESLKRPRDLSIPSNSVSDQNCDTEIATQKRQKLQAPLSNKEMCRAYRSRKGEALTNYSTIEVDTR